MKVNYLIELWLIEIVKAIVKLFFNPLFYWFFIFVFILGVIRIKQERYFFGIKIFNLFHEWKRILVISLISGLVLSLVTIGAGFIFNYEILIILIISMLIMSLSFNPAYLSAVYTIGLTYIVLLFLPLLSDDLSFQVTMPTNMQFTQLTILLGLFLIVEAIFIKKIKDNQIPPSLKLSNRGVWIGALNMKKASLIPIFMFVPADKLSFIADFWPSFSIAETQYSLVLFPFIIGYNYQIINEYIHRASNKISKQTLYLGIFILILASASFYYPIFSFIAILIAIIGKELITIKYKMKSKKGEKYYAPLNQGLKVLAIIPNTPAERLNILVGETITRVNNKEVNNEKEFYRALQDKSASFKLDVLNKDQEVRFITGSLYEFEDHNLGLVFPGEPYKS